MRRLVVAALLAVVLQGCVTVTVAPPRGPQTQEPTTAKKAPTP